MVEQKRQRDEYTSWVIVMVLCRWWSLLSIEISCSFVAIVTRMQHEHWLVCVCGIWICKNERKKTSEFRTRRWLKSTNRIAVLLKFLAIWAQWAHTLLHRLMRRLKVLKCMYSHNINRNTYLQFRKKNVVKMSQFWII